MNEKTKDAVAALIIAGTIVGSVVGGIGFILWGWPQYSVYSNRLAGEAALAKAQAQREVIVREALAKRDAAVHLSDAEIARARGVAEANKIIGESLHGNEAYLRYLWIQTLDHAKGTVVYVPTEANLPILEATRLPQVKP